MDAQQLSGKVTQLESRVATLEDEGKIVRGEVKQILTEIRSAILIRDNPFESETTSSFNRTSTAPPTVVQVMAAPEPAPTHLPDPQPMALDQELDALAPPPKREIHGHADEFRAQATPEPPREPVMLRPNFPQTAALHAPEPAKPQWSLLTIAGLSAWAEDAMRRIGSLRLEILLDLCEAAGHLPPDARLALARVTEMDIPEPEHVPSTNETTVILRQLDALVYDQDIPGSARARI